MTPEQREEIKKASEELLRIYSTVPRPNCADEYQRFNRAANPAAIRSLIDQVEALTVPQGWKMVPVESTGAMDVAGMESLGCDEATQVDAECCYNAMLDAAPTIPAIPGTKEGV